MSDFEVVSVESQPILYVHRTSATDPASMGACMGGAYGILMGFMGQHGIQMTGAPLAIYHGYTEAEATFYVAVPVSKGDSEHAAGHADIKPGATHAGRALKTVHVGPYSKLVDSYNGIMAHMEREGLRPAGPSWEVYMNDPASTPEADLVTEIYFPLD